MKFLDELNTAQKEAAMHIDGAMLILAGAGSGKTKTITTRLAYLIGEVGIDPLNTLTLTFTNKAAMTMKTRALSMIKNNANCVPLLCTFHKFGLMFLKLYIHELNRSNNFVIIDTEDKKKILKEIESKIPTPVISKEISDYKNKLLSIEDILNTSDFVHEYSKTHYQQIAQAYKKYEEYLNANNLVDFDDLLALSYKILDKNPQIAEQTSKLYKYITVDEYQDTNELQYKLLKKLCLTHNNIVVVGDDDQSIYGWRGAKIENILNFKNQFENVKLIKLEENYRSTPAILEAANELIEHNRSRLGKTLKSTIKSSNEVNILHNDDEKSEARAIAVKIKKLLQSGVNPNQIAILYRINALSRGLEEGLNVSGIPYKIVGGVKFYERTEIKDIICYFRLLLNPNDDFSLERVINRPKRGLGSVGLAKLQKFAHEHKKSLFSSIFTIPEDLIGKKVKKSLLELTQNINELKQMPLHEVIKTFEEKIKISEYYSQLPDGSDRVANIDEFFGSLKIKLSENDDFSLEEFLNEITLQSDQDIINDETISIMSVHASKGLEFEYLFVIGLEEGFFPLIGDGNDIEEERRLGYVAFTRAKYDLNLSYVNTRLYRRNRTVLKKSRFLCEAGLCDGLLHMDNNKNNTDFKKGELIKHKIFGIGRILEVSKINSESKLKINFGGNIKEIMSSFVEKIV